VPLPAAPGGAATAMLLAAKSAPPPARKARPVYAEFIGLG
jgi:hypothetical protein